jgi:hypothetical protein
MPQKQTSWAFRFRIRLALDMHRRRDVGGARDIARTVAVAAFALEIAKTLPEVASISDNVVEIARRTNLLPFMFPPSR